MYRITIIDENWKEVREKIDENINRVIEENERMKRHKLIGPFMRVFRNVVGIDFDICISREWINDRTCIFYISAPIPLKEEFYDKDVKKFADWGKIKIERLDSKGNVVFRVI